MDISKMLKDANKIISVKKLIPLYISLILIVLIFFLCFVLNKNSLYYELEVRGSVKEIIEQPKEVYYKIGNRWYLIKDELVDEIAIGDSIYKTKETYNMLLFNKNKALKKSVTKKHFFFIEKAPVQYDLKQ